MIGFIDLEANTDTDAKYKRTVFDIISISFMSEDLSVNFNSFVRPVDNNGKLFERIIDMTGITQEQVDNGISFEKVVDILYDYSLELDTIYTWGGYDIVLLRKNCKNLSKVNRRRINSIIDKIADLSEEVKKSFSLKNSISLINTAYILDLDYDSHHNAESDCKLLRDIYLALKKNNINQVRLNEFKYVDSLRQYGQKIVFDSSHFKLYDCKTNKEIILRDESNDLTVDDIDWSFCGGDPDNFF